MGSGRAASWCRERAAGAAWGLVLALALAVPLVFDPGSADIFGASKVATLGMLLVPALGLLALSWFGPANRTPAPRLAVAAAALLAVTLLSLLLSDRPGLGFAGAYSRHGGLAQLLLYIGAALAVAALVGASPRRATQLVVALAAAATVVALYALFQSAGIDAYDFVDAFGGDPYPGATLGNSNFAGGFLAAVLPLLALPWMGAHDRRLRAASAALAVLLAGGIWVTQSRGALLGGLVGGVVLVLLERHRLPRWLRRTAAGATAATAVVLVLVVWHPLLDGPPAPFDRLDVFRTESVDVRAAEWRVAWEIGLDHPLFGAGPESYSALYPRYRPAAEAQRDGLRFPDEPHDALLEQWATTGLAGLASLLAVHVLTWRGALRRRSAGEPDVPAALVVALLAALAAHTTQALVSVDVAPLALTGWLLLGCLAGLTDGRISAWREGRHREPAADARRRPTGSRRPPLVAVPVPVRIAVVVALCALGVLNAGRPWLADRAAAAAAAALARGDLETAGSRWADARALHGQEATYWLQAATTAEVVAVRTRSTQALLEAGALHQQAVVRRPGDARFLAARARLLTQVAVARGDAAGFETGREAWDVARMADPWGWEVRDGIAAHHLAWAVTLPDDEEVRDHLRVAEEEWRYVVTAQGTDVEGWSGLAQARELLGDLAGARDALLFAVALAPDEPTFQERLDAVESRLGD